MFITKKYIVILIIDFVELNFVSIHAFIKTLYDVTLICMDRQPILYTDRLLSVYITYFLFEKFIQNLKNYIKKMWVEHSHVIHLPCFALEETFFITSVFTLKLYYALILYILSIILQINSHILFTSDFICLISANKWMSLYPWEKCGKWKKYPRQLKLRYI